MKPHRAPRERWRLRAARDADAERIAELIVISGDSPPEFPWPPAESAKPIVVLANRRAAKKAQGFAVRNSIIVEAGGEVAGVMLGFRVQENADAIRQGRLPAYLRPTSDVEAICPESFYVNTVALFPEFQGCGFGSVLLGGAMVKAGLLGCGSVTLEVSSCNERAQAVYCRHGFKEAGYFRGTPGAAHPYEKDFVLMCRAIRYPDRNNYHLEDSSWLRQHSIS